MSGFSKENSNYVFALTAVSIKISSKKNLLTDYVSHGSFIIFISSALFAVSSYLLSCSLGSFLEVYFLA